MTAEPSGVPDGWADPLDEPIRHPLLGRRVRVVLARKGDPVNGSDDADPNPLRLAEDQYVVGTLVKLTACGEVDIRRDDGQMRYCWPALHIEEAQ